MSWGLFLAKEGERLICVHVAPSDEWGGLDVGHILDAHCGCNPEPDTREDGLPMLVHRRFAWR